MQGGAHLRGLAEPAQPALLHQLRCQRGGLRLSLRPICRLQHDGWVDASVWRRQHQAACPGPPTHMQASPAGGPTPGAAAAELRAIVLLRCSGCCCSDHCCRRRRPLLEPAGGDAVASALPLPGQGLPAAALSRAYGALPAHTAGPARRAVAGIAGESPRSSLWTPQAAMCPRDRIAELGTRDRTPAETMATPDGRRRRSVRSAATRCEHASNTFDTGPNQLHARSVTQEAQHSCRR